MSKLEVNTVAPQCGTTLTLGESGDTVTLGTGASQTGFGKTGAVDWDTSSIKTATFTAVSGNGYFCNTAGGAFEIDLPSSPSAGAIVGIKDYNGSFGTNALTIDRNGSKLDGNAANKLLITDYLSLTLVYVDTTQGWVPIEEGAGNIGESFMTATGGCVTTSGNDKIHTFTGPGTFCVSAIASCATQNTVSHVVIAGGGGGGGGYQSGGGGAGGYREVQAPGSPYTASPLNGYPSAPNRVTVTATAYPITVGSGGAGSPTNARGTSGNQSVFSSITSAGGGGGGTFSPTTGPTNTGKTGGSGGGAGRTCGSTSGGAGNTPPVTPAQGFPGGDGANPYTGPYNGGGGGGATAQGPDVSGSSVSPGGAGATSEITASPVQRAGGGGGGGNPAPGGAAGAGGGGAGGSGPTVNGADGTDNTGGGGGGSGGPSNTGGSGGSGVVIIRYRYQ
jgi:hypothetical protein